jgi:hypothetical protein
MTAAGITSGRGRNRDASDAVDEEASLTTRAEAAAEAELRGDRSNILGAIDAAPLIPLNRTRHVPDRWSFYYVLERMEEGFRTLSRLPLPTRPRGYVNSMPTYLYDRGDLNAQLETHELERMARTRNRVRIPPSPAEIARMEEALHWPAAHLGGAEFHHLARAVNLGALWAAFDVNIDERVKRLKITRRAFQARKIQGLRIIARELVRHRVPIR